MRDRGNGNSGLSFSSVLTLIFITLKLTGYINWSWWLVVSPTLISGGILILAIIIGTLW